eukprot:139875-Rhodomonas_salina.3
MLLGRRGALRTAYLWFAPSSPILYSPGQWLPFALLSLSSVLSSETFSHTRTHALTHRVLLLPVRNNAGKIVAIVAGTLSTLCFQTSVCDAQH